MQEEDFRWFVDNMPSLYEKYGDCYLAIKNKTVIGRYTNFADGVRETQNIEPIGSFIVQQCGKDEFAYTNYISSMSFI